MTICHNLINFMKENRDNLVLVQTWARTSSEPNTEYAGDAYCSFEYYQKNKACLKYLDLELADKICREAGEYNDYFVLIL